MDLKWHSKLVKLAHTNAAQDNKHFLYVNK